jgi:hypothetical protein
VYVWVSRDEAEDITRWAMEAGTTRQPTPDIADRFFRAARSAARRRPPLFSRWRWRENHPILLHCKYCQEWEAFRRHRDAKRTWVKHGAWPGWLHSECLPLWQDDPNDVIAERRKASSQEEANEFLFGEPELLKLHHGVFVRHAQVSEHTHAGLLDDEEARLQADAGNQIVRSLIDSMPEELRKQLVGAAFTNYYRGYHVLMVWADDVPTGYDGTHVGEVHFRSELVAENLPRSLRRQLPEHLRACL